MFDYQGGNWATICVDEVTQFSRVGITYPRSRQRRQAGSRVPIRWRGATNPGGIGHEYIKGRYVKTPEGKDPSTPNRQFFPAKLEDNPHIDRSEYIETLLESGLDELTLAQLLAGDWDAVPGGRFQRTWFRSWHRRGDYVVLVNPNGGYREFLLKNALVFATVDPAASDKRTADWTVVSTWAVSPWGDLVWLGCSRFQLQIPDIVPKIQAEVLRFAPKYLPGVAELKVGKNKPTSDQVCWLELFRSAGIRAEVWRPADWPEIEQALGHKLATSQQDS